MLDRIITVKRREIDRDFRGLAAGQMLKEVQSLPPARDFKAALQRPGLSLIAEVKPASPSRGVLAADVDPAVFAASYEDAGADAISVLTDKEFFGGDVRSLKVVQDACSLPILRKDFILDERQIYQARLAGADAVLLIAAILDDKILARLYDAAREAGLRVLAEAHDETEVYRLTSLGCEIIGINNRNLSDLSVDLGVTEGLAKAATGAVLVSESGIKTGDDAARVARCGADAVLVGEALMTAADISSAVRSIKGILN